MPQYGFLLVLMQPPANLEEEFNAWYDTEHVPERLAVPGVLTAIRFSSVTATIPTYLAIYDLESERVLDSEAYLRVAGDNSSPWTKRVTTTFQGTNTKTFTLPITLDGAFNLKLAGPANANYDLIVRSGGKIVDRTTRKDSKDEINYKLACRDRRTEKLKITVIRRSGGGGGPYTLTAKYAG